MSIFAQDFSEQPKAVRELLTFAEEIKRKAAILQPKSVLVLGMGASYYAGLYATVYANTMGMNCRCEELSEVVWYWSENSFDLYDTIVLVSQSGETAELKKLVEKYPRIRKKSVLVTNNPNSSAAKVLGEDRVFLIHAGQERAMGSTKTFVNSIVTLLLILSQWAGKPLNPDGLDDHLESALAVDIHDYVESVAANGQLVLVGRGFSVPILRMAQLTLAEVARFNCSWYSGGGFRHGAMELMVGGIVSTFIHVEGKTSQIMARFARELSRFDGLWLISNVETIVPRCVRLKEGLTEELAPIPAIVVFQRLADELARRRGYPSGVGMIATKVTSEE
ncbi:SIS domain-containing protein [Thermotoga caldifontis]|uniref:SIS domain-containing protein n=1 Tax=Thermotoga caldifontis TaxID=1508419 RepID=UPI000597BD67|nr:SIS domain-containing protein [Thermotoga caldifontis]